MALEHRAEEGELHDIRAGGDDERRDEGLVSDGYRRGERENVCREQLGFSQRLEIEGGNDLGEEVDATGDLELDVTGDAFQDLRDVLEPGLPVDRVADRLRFLREHLVHELVDRVAGEEVVDVDGFPLAGPVDTILRLLGRFGGVLEIDDDDVVRRGDREAAVEAVEGRDDRGTPGGGGEVLDEGEPLLRRHLGGDREDAETMPFQVLHDRRDHRPEAGEDDRLLAPVRRVADDLAHLLELVPRLGLEVSAIEVVDRDGTGRRVPELPERGGDDPHVRVPLVLAKRLRDRLLRPRCVAAVEARPRLVEIEEDDPPFLRREDVDVVLPATHGERRHEPPETIEVTDFREELRAPFVKGVLELARHELVRAEFVQEALGPSAVGVREEGIVETEEPRDVPEDVRRVSLHDRAGEDELPFRSHRPHGTAAEGVLRLRELRFVDEDGTEELLQPLVRRPLPAVAGGGPRLVPAAVAVAAPPLAHVHALRTLLDHVFVGALADGARRLRVVGDVVVKDAVLRVLDALPRVVDAGAREGEELERGDVELRRCGEMLPSLLVLDGGDAAVRRKAPGVEAELPEFIEPILNERGLADYEDALESARPRPSRGRDGLPAALLVAEVAEQLHGEPGDVFSLKREQKRRRARDRRAVLRETRGNDRVEIGDIREIEGGGQKLDVRGVDFAERARAAIGHDLEREVAAIDGGDELDVFLRSLVPRRFDGGRFTIANP